MWSSQLCIFAHSIVHCARTLRAWLWLFVRHRANLTWVTRMKRRFRFIDYLSVAWARNRDTPDEVEILPPSGSTVIASGEIFAVHGRRLASSELSVEWRDPLASYLNVHKGVALVWCNGAYLTPSWFHGRFIFSYSLVLRYWQTVHVADSISIDIPWKKATKRNVILRKNVQK